MEIDRSMRVELPGIGAYKTIVAWRDDATGEGERPTCANEEWDLSEKSRRSQNGRESTSEGTKWLGTL